MIDIHTHILNNVDDGARDSIESLTCLKLAEKAGFTDIILTPHYIENSFENGPSIIQPKIEELKSKVEDNQINIKLYIGNEVYVSDNMVERMENGEIATLAGSRYFLFELPLESKIIVLDTIISKIKEVGAIPVLAHPERYSFVQHNPNVLIELISKGTLMQCNYGSILGRYGKSAKRALVKMLKSNMVHFLGTDTHRSGSIYKDFEKVEKNFLKYINKRKFNELTIINPKCVLQDILFDIEEPVKTKQFKFF